MWAGHLGAGQEGLKGADDDVLLQAIADRYEDAVLVTADDHMPEDWARVIVELGSTIAVIAPRVGDLADAYATDEEWERDIVQRWIHVIEEQERSTIRRYWPTTHLPWSPLR